MPQPLARIVEQLKREPSRTGSIVITVFGDAIVTRGGSVWLGTLLAFFEALDIDSGVVRTAMSRLASEVHVDASIMGYVSEIVSATRADKDSALGVSIRGALALARALKTWAIASGRTFVTPDDVRELAVPVLAHRIIVDPESEFAGVTGADIVARALVEVTPPAYRAA